ncbi:MAG: D-3-phosphoglycerate dehydrogenase, partial [Frankiales bacterium]|nr:D-3-phosphoglycerate dehydrogenase [Frankiales bacterium]
IVGLVGERLGTAQINIAGAQVSRTSLGGDALMALTVDSAPSADILAEIAAAIGAASVRSVDLA